MRKIKTKRIKPLLEESRLQEKQSKTLVPRPPGEIALKEEDIPAPKD